MAEQSGAGVALPPKWMCGFCGAKEGQDCPEAYGWRNGEVVKISKPAPCRSTRVPVEPNPGNGAPGDRTQQAPSSSPLGTVSMGCQPVVWFWSLIGFHRR
jgi:hypothetical protein